MLLPGVFWLGFITFADSVILISLIETKFKANTKLGPGPGRAVYVLSFLLHTVAPAIAWYLGSLRTAIAVNSLFGLVWGLFFYFIFDRFIHIPVIFFVSSLASLWKYVKQ